MSTLPVTLGFLQNIGLPEMIVIGLIMLLLFGSRLPEVGKSLGRGIVEFKKGIKGIEDETDARATNPPRQINQSQTMPPVQTNAPQTVSRNDNVQ